MIRVVHFLTVLFLGAQLAACSGGDSSEEHLENARVLVEQANYREAIVELKTSLNKDVHNVAARALLGKVYYETGDFDGAEKELSRALVPGSDVDRSTVIPLIARTLIQMGEYSRIDGLSVEGLNSEARSTTLAVKALARLYQDDPVVAEEIMYAALSIKPMPLYTLVASARFSMARQDYAAAKMKLKGILKQHPDYLPAWNLQGDILAAQKLPKKAEKAYERVLKISSRAFDARLNRAMMRIYLGDYPGAREDLKKLKKIHRSAATAHPGVSFAEGITLLQSGSYVKARKAFEKTADFSYAYPLSYYYMAVIDLQQGSLERALGEVYRFLALAPESLAGPKLAARLELENEGYHAAEQLLQPIVEMYPKDVEALNLLSSAKLGLGKGGQGVELLGRVVQMQPKSAAAQTRLSAGYFATGEIELGVELLKRTIHGNPKSQQADILLILNYLRENKVEQAIVAARGYKRRHPGSTTSFSLLGRAYFADSQFEKSSWAYHRAIELDATDTAARHGLAEIAIQEGNFKSARHYYNRVLAYNEDDLQTQLKLAASYALEGNDEIMRSMLEIAIDDHPESTEPLLVLIRYYMAAGRLDAADPLIDRLAAIQRDQPDALATLGGYQLATGRFNQALITLERLLTIRPEIGQYHFMRAKAFSALGETENTMLELSYTVELDPDHFYAKIALARLALIRGKTEVFRRRLEDLRAIAPQNIDVLQLKVADAKQRGDKKRTAQLLQHIYQQVPTTANVVALAEYKNSQGDGRGALAILEQWAAERQEDVAVRQKLARFYSDLGMPDKARGQYQAILEIDHDNIVALNNLSWEMLKNEPHLALRYAERAYDLSPESAAVLDTLAMAQLRNGKMAEARRTLGRALEKSPDDPEILFHEAQVMFAEGQKQAAVNALSIVLAQHGEFPARTAAEAMLKRLQ